jgi:hypothetical protein
MIQVNHHKSSPERPQRVEMADKGVLSVLSKAIEHCMTYSVPVDL